MLELGISGDRQLCPDDRLDARDTGGLMKPGRAVEAIAIEERERGIPEFGCAIDERLGR
jgi:hypothetical protein